MLALRCRKQSNMPFEFVEVKLKKRKEKRKKCGFYTFDGAFLCTLPIKMQNWPYRKEKATHTQKHTNMQEKAKRKKERHVIHIVISSSMEPNVWKQNKQMKQKRNQSPGRQQPPLSGTAQ